MMAAMELLPGARCRAPLLIAEPTIGIDLPLKALAWEDREGKVWLSYNAPEYVEERFAMDLKPIGGIGALIEQAHLAQQKTGDLRGLGRFQQTRASALTAFYFYRATLFADAVGCFGAMMPA